MRFRVTITFHGEAVVEVEADDLRSAIDEVEGEDLEELPDDAEITRVTVKAVGAG